MHTLRYNPLTERWMLLGGPLEHTLHIASAHQLEIGHNEHFFAASHPQSPFVLEAPLVPPVARGLLFMPEPPLGDYELLLQRSEAEISQWNVQYWEGWIMLLQHRLLQINHHPQLKHVQFFLESAKQRTTLPYRRVGDLVATSQPLTPYSTIATALIARIEDQERAFVVAEDQYGSLYVPSAPTFHDEIWYLPRKGQPNFAAVHGAARTAVAQSLTLLIRLLNSAHLQFDWVIELHTSLQSESREQSWWLQFYRASQTSNSPFTIQRIPESFVQQLRYAAEALAA